MFELAGEVGVEPWSFSLRQLVLMARGRRKVVFRCLGEVLAMIAEVNRDRDKRREPFTWRDFDLLAEPKRPEKPTRLPPKQFVQAVGDAVKAGNAKSR